MHVVILAAGMGSRLGRPEPKPLTQLASGRTILEQQLAVLGAALDEIRVTIVVGFKKDLIMEAFPDATFVYNQRFDQTNTSKSLLKGLEATGDEPVLWLNGDVVFDDEMMPLLVPELTSGQSFVSVDRAQVGDEEVKYLVDDAGRITELSKNVVGGLGEAVGINFVSRSDKAALIESLRSVSDDDYFERGIEVMIDEHERVVHAVDVSAAMCIEVDFESDLEAANLIVAPGRRSTT